MTVSCLITFVLATGNALALREARFAVALSGALAARFGAALDEVTAADASAGWADSFLRDLVAFGFSATSFNR